MERRKTGNLRKGRVSIPGARYFITLNVHQRKRVLCSKPVFKDAKEFLNMAHKKDLAHFLGFILMPDHVHWLFRLGASTSVEQTLRMLKFHLGSRLRASGYRWQSNFFEHRLRESEDAETYGRYIFLNPYRAGLIGRNEIWPFWIENQEFQFRFEASLEEGKYPPQAWLDEASEHPVEAWKKENDISL